jgi:hypothetical protein
MSCCDGITARARIRDKTRNRHRVYRVCGVPTWVDRVDYEAKGKKAVTKVGAPMKTIQFIGKILWKTVLIVGALVIGSLGAYQVGWSGADLIVNAPFNGAFGDFISGLFFSVGGLAASGAVFLVQRIAKPVLWVMVPILLYCAAVPGAWNGVVSDFDATRGAVMKRHYANAYAIAHMTDKGRYLSCHDENIELTADAKAACTKALTVAPGERIPGSEHRCRPLKMFGCFDTAPEK